MISKLSYVIAGILLKKEIISQDDRELYEYGIFMLLSYLGFFILVILSGTILTIPLEAVVFFLSFCYIRNLMGGVHADTEKKCTVLTTISLIISLIVIKIMIELDLILVATISVVLSFLIIIFSKPVSSPEKEISDTERRIFHKKARFLSLFIVILFIVNIVMSKHNLAMALSIGLLLSVILFVIGKFQQHKRTNKNLEIK